jgi:Na+/proline symporter
VASGLVRDVYQRFLRPTASEREVEWASYSATVCVGLLAAGVALNPPQYLQLIVVFASAGMASAFLIPALMGAFWRRATAAGALASMATGAAVCLSLYAYGSYLGHGNKDQGIGPKPQSFGAYYLLGFDPCVWGLLSSLAAGVIVSLVTSPPDPGRVALLFDEQPPDAPAPATLELHPDRAPA